MNIDRATAIQSRSRSDATRNGRRSAKYKWNPAHSIGTCGFCGGEMIYNVPRLGAAGGYCHKETDDIRCPSSPNEKVQA